MLNIYLNMNCSWSKAIGNGNIGNGIKNSISSILIVVSNDKYNGKWAFFFLPRQKTIQLSLVKTWNWKKKLGQSKENKKRTHQSHSIFCSMCTVCVFVCVPAKSGRGQKKDGQIKLGHRWQNPWLKDLHKTLEMNAHLPIFVLIEFCDRIWWNRNNNNKSLHKRSHQHWQLFLESTVRMWIKSCLLAQK